jgi:predicted phage-related endonuclease
VAITDEQRELRKKGIFASDAARIMEGDGVSVALEKMGLKEPQNFDDNMEVEIGNLVEPSILDAYEAERKPVLLERSPSTLIHPQFPWFGAHLDAISHDDVELDVECKSVGEYNRSKWGDGGDEVPDRVLSQVQAQLSVSGLKRADIPVMFVNAEALKHILTGRLPPIKIFTVNADEELQAYIINKSQKIYDCIQTQTLPEAESLLDVRLLYGKSTGEVIEADDEVFKIYEALLSTREELRRIEERKELQELEIKAFMKTASELRYGKQRLATWKNDADGSKLDAKALIEKHPKLAARFMKTKPGARKLLLKKPKEIANE